MEGNFVRFLSFPRIDDFQMLKQFKKFVPIFGYGLASWLCLASPVWAQVGQEEEEPKTYVPVYIIIIAAVGLGLLIICNPSRRQVSFRKDD